MSGAGQFAKSCAVLVSAGYRGSRKWMITAALLEAVSGGAIAVLPYVFRLFVDAVTYRQAHQLEVSVVLVPVLFALWWVTDFLGDTSTFQVAQMANLYLSERIATLVNSVPGLEHFERPEYLRELDLLNENQRLISGASQQLLYLLVQFVRTVVMLVLLATVDPYFLLLPVAALAPFAADALAVRYRQRCDNELAEPMRLANALFAISSTAGPAKELRIFGLGEDMIRRHDALADQIIARTSKAGLVAAGAGAIGWVVFAAAFVAITAEVVVEAVHGHATPGKVLMVIVLVQNVQAQITQVTSSTGQLGRARKTAERYLWLEDHAAQQATRGATAEVPERLNDGIVFDHVTFTYPGTEIDVLRDISIRLPAGAAVAVVGENGAGKSTFVKLLTRLYEPTKGSIRVDGNDLASFEVDDWRRHLAVTFQDFARYELAAGSVVGLGDLPNLDNPDAVLSALERAGASGVLDRFDEGLATQLGRSFADGRELSGGEWQKLALGRGRMRAAPLVLVLDEPTSSLDAPTEYSLFERYLEASRATTKSRGTITILVSHRFSTVRIADLIIVLEGGRITEFGSHNELMAGGRTYAELFRLQSTAYA